VDGAVVVRFWEDVAIRRGGGGGIVAGRDLLLGSERPGRTHPAFEPPMSLDAVTLHRRRRTSIPLGWGDGCRSSPRPPLEDAGADTLPRTDRNRALRTRLFSARASPRGACAGNLVVTLRPAGATDQATPPSPGGGNPPAAVRCSGTLTIDRIRGRRGDGTAPCRRLVQFLEPGWWLLGHARHRRSSDETAADGAAARPTNSRSFTSGA